MLTYFSIIFNEVYRSGLLIDEIKHGLVALPFALWLAWKTRKYVKGIIVILVAYFIDLDHLVDYWNFFGLKLDLLEFFKLDFYEITHRATVFFHAWEWVVLLAYFAYKQGWKKSWITPILVGVFAHLLWDAWTQQSVLFYSIIYRVIMGFVIPQ